MTRFDFDTDDTEVEREHGNTSTLDTWSLNDFDDLLHPERRSPAYPIGDEWMAYPS